MTRTRRWFTVLILELLSSGGLTLAARQQGTADPPRFRIAVDVVRLDAVVKDANGNLVTDLTADDFDVHQDGRPQKITVVRWIPTAGPQAATTAESSPSPATSTATARAVERLAPADVQRTILIVVDDLGTSFESYPATREALHRLVDEQLGPRDLIGIVRTSAYANGLQQFTTDRKVLHAAIDALEWHWQSRTGVEALAPYSQSASISIGGRIYRAPGFAELDSLRASMSAQNTFAALVSLVHATKQLPGRKTMILVSEGMRMVDRFDGPGAEIGQGVIPDIRITMPRDHLEDQAVRAGVVIYALDPRGLVSGRLRADDDTAHAGATDLAIAGADRHQFLMDTQDSLQHISQQTGGFAILNTNDLANGFKRITDDQRGYYLIGYTPDDTTFAKPGKTVRYHKISVEVKRRGLNVRTHAGFLGRSDDDKATGKTTPTDELLLAALSPFTDGAVRVHLTADVAQGGELAIVSHVQADRVGPDGADVLGLVIDPLGEIVAKGTATLGDSPVDAPMRVPKPGTYQVRFAVRDRQSNAIGSDVVVVTVPDRVHATAAAAPAQ